MDQSTVHNRRRDKPVLSCSFCRGRKLRCDRQSPCSACERRGKAAECTYSASERERQHAIDYRPHARRQQARQRVARLENLVTEMRDMAQSSHHPPGNNASPSDSLTDLGPSPPAPPPNGHQLDDMGKLSLMDNHAVYTGSSHWVTILEDIQHLKDELSEDYSDISASPKPTSADAGLMHGSPATRISLLNSGPCLPKDQILAMVPPRKVVDRHISRFFNAFDKASFLIYRKKFLEEYTNFWANPSAAPIMWVGLLFGVMSMSTLLQQQDLGALGLSTVESQDMLNNYRTLTIHCLVAGDYLRPSRYTIETLALHFTVDQNVNVDTSIGNWILMGVVIRVAFRVGLHRDPSHWPNIRPLQAELRRRLWMALYQMDFFTSTQVGLPRIIKDSQCDTRPPAHLFEDDIGLEHDEMPPERPLTEQTAFLYVIQRNTIIKVAAEIYDVTEAGPPSSATIAMLEAKLEKAIDAIPPWLRYRSLETAIVDNPLNMMNQIFLDVIIHKSVYLLHRRSFIRGSVGGDNNKSKERCINAAMAILEHQRRISEEIQPGGLMFGNRWKITSSIRHEFLQATMMLCFALGRFNDDYVGTTRRADIVEALTVAKGVWEKNVGRSLEAQRAANAIAIVLQQDLAKSSAPLTSAVSDGLFGHMPGEAAESYSDGFDYGQNIALDPSLFSAEDYMAAFCSVDEFITEQSHP